MTVSEAQSEIRRTKRTKRRGDSLSFPPPRRYRCSFLSYARRASIFLCLLVTSAAAGVTTAASTTHDFLLGTQATVGAQGDLLPLPTGPELDQWFGSTAFGSGKTSGQLRPHQRHARRWLDEGLTALNQLAGSLKRVATNVSSAQQKSLDRLHGVYRSAARQTRFGQPAQALSNLLSSRGGYSDSLPEFATGSIASLRKDAAKLPQLGSGKVPLTSIMPQPWRDSLETCKGFLNPTPWAWPRVGGQPLVRSLWARFFALTDMLLRNSWKHCMTPALRRFFLANVVGSVNSSSSFVKTGVFA